MFVPDQKKTLDGPRCKRMLFPDQIGTLDAAQYRNIERSQ